MNRLSRLTDASPAKTEFMLNRTRPFGSCEPPMASGHGHRHQPDHKDKQPEQDDGEQTIAHIDGFLVCVQPHAGSTGCRSSRSVRYEKSARQIIRLSNTHSTMKHAAWPLPARSVDFHLESAVFMFHSFAYDLENRQVLASRVFGSVYGFWLALFQLTEPTPQTRGCLRHPSAPRPPKAAGPPFDS